jgi:hypothetical protein
MNLPSHSQRMNSVSVWFGLFGGAAAWSVHLLSASAIAEWGYYAGLSQVKWLGLNAIEWLILGVTVTTLAISAAATWVAYRAAGRVRRTDGGESHNTCLFLTYAGIATSGTFMFIILAQSVPLIFLRNG